MQLQLAIPPERTKLINSSIGFYAKDDFDSIMMTVAFMYLCRIKSAEQLKHHSPGEMGKLLGLDRVAEARCLRSILKELSDQPKQFIQVLI